MVVKSFLFSLIVQNKLGLKPAMYYLLVGLLSFFFAWQQLSASTNTLSSPTLPQQNFAAILTHCSLFGQSQLHLPFESAPAPKDHEIPDETELEEDVDFDSHLLLEETSLDAFPQLAGVNTLFTHTQSCVHARAQIPLFILYHSWKSFMC